MNDREQATFGIQILWFPQQFYTQDFLKIIHATSFSFLLKAIFFRSHSFRASQIEWRNSGGWEAQDQSMVRFSKR
jgi:hypothetical protein